jgi:hypothetical protein
MNNTRNHETRTHTEGPETDANAKHEKQHPHTHHTHTHTHPANPFPPLPPAIGTATEGARDMAGAKGAAGVADSDSVEPHKTRDGGGAGEVDVSLSLGVPTYATIRI